MKAVAQESYLVIINFANSETMTFMTLNWWFQEKLEHRTSKVQEGARAYVSKMQPETTERMSHIYNPMEGPETQ